MWVRPQVPVGGASLSTPPPPGAPPHASPGCPLPEHRKKCQGCGREEGGGGGRGRGRLEREGVWLEGRVGPPVQWRGGGHRPKHTWGQTHILGCRGDLGQSLHHGDKFRTKSRKKGCTLRGSCNTALLRKALRRFSNRKCFLEEFLEGACKGFQ